MRNLSTRFVLLTVAVPLILGAQTTPPAPAYRVLTVFRETVKPGKRVAHNAHEVAWAKANIAAKNPTPMLAATAMSGAPETWYMSVFSSWAEYEASNKATNSNATLSAIDERFSAKEDEYLSDGRMMVFRFREDLSYGPPANIAASRYFTIARASVRPGHVSEYEEVRKMVKAAHESAHLSDSFSIWESADGVANGTFLTIVARKSLAELDSGAAIHGAAYQTALGGPEAQKKMEGMAASAIINGENNVFAFVPDQSIPPPEWIAADPKYWKPAAKIATTKATQ